jgi:8-oxo-dGTP pyrophosphatase MutT (NUDIX family)/phosphohistidine phosphatase SixA
LMATNVIDERIKAAGGVVWRPGAAAGGGPQVALIHRPRYDDWSFPKGKADPDEHPVLTALREIEEETALRCELGRRLPSIEYEVLGRTKRVRYWVARVAESAPFTPNDEVDGLKWLEPAEAARRLTSPLDLAVLEAFLAAPADTYPIVLQRHGKAEHRGGRWDESRGAGDLARPLAPAGFAQADALAVLLGAYGAREVISSPAVRCVETVRPYADLHGMKLRTDPALTEISYVHAPRAVVAWLRQLIEARRGTVVCTHGPLLDELISAVLYNPGFGGFSGAGSGPTLSGRPWDPGTADRWANEPLAKGGAWVLHFDAAADPAQPRLLAVDRLKP